ncbi:MAG: hypothetical protein LH609_16920 [Rudanella sp.]|nr:hypothetical protein [Rudanella sp.]
MANSSASSDGSRQANMVSNENAETMFGAGQAETNMVKLVDGKLTPMGDTEDDVMDEQLRNRYSSDEERSLQGFSEKTYENSDAALRTGDGAEPSVMPESAIAEADITASQANNSTPADRVQPNGEDMKSTATSSFFVSADMVPTLPSTPDPNNPIPSGPDTPVPPMSPDPAPEIMPLPGQPIPAQPEIQEPGEPDRLHQIGFEYARKNDVTSWPTDGNVSFTATIVPTSADQLPITNDDMEPGKAVPGTQYEGMAAGPPAGSEDEGMDDQPETGDSSHPYDVKGNKDSSYQPGERPQEAAQMMSQPHSMLDESGVKAQEMTGKNADRSDVKSTDGLDRKYNDLDAEKSKTAY